MRALGTTALLLVAGAGLGCGGGGDSGDGGVGPPAGLDRVEVTPATSTLFTVAPGNTVALSVAALDQDGDPVSGAGAPSFSSDNVAVADAAADGTVTAVGAGSARITASVTADGVTKTGTSSVTVQVAPSSAQVQAPQFVFQPAVVDVQAGGGVTWTFGPIPHDVTFTSPGAPANIPLLENGSAVRAFPNNGIFDYTCTIHPSMQGMVRVH
jgi:plastocyanin